MHERAFVLQPLCDIDPNIEHPLLQMRVGALLEALDAPSFERHEVEGW